MLRDRLRSAQPAGRVSRRRLVNGMLPKLQKQFDHFSKESPHLGGFTFRLIPTLGIAPSPQWFEHCRSLMAYAGENTPSRSCTDTGPGLSRLPLLLGYGS